MSIVNHWTGGQYSLFRIIFGTYLFVHFVQLVPWGKELFSNRGVLPDASASPLLHLFPNIFALWDTPVFVTLMLIIAASLSLLFCIGLYDRSASLAIWYVWACLFGRNPLISNPSLPYVGWLLIAHAFLPPSPYGSWAARGRDDPGSDWRMPAAIFAAAWILMAVGYTYSGFTKLASPSWVDGTAFAKVLNNPLARPTLLRDWLLALPAPASTMATWGVLAMEITFAPLALIRRLRPWVWTMMLGMHFALMLVLDFADLSLGMIMLHLFTFDPSWVTSKRTLSPETIFYDGHCGLCHRTVRFVLSEDAEGTLFRFAPLHGETFLKTMPASGRHHLPDSLVLYSNAGQLLLKSNAVAHILLRLGGFWRIFGLFLKIIPAPARDLCYNVIARNRYRLFQSPPASCPILPPQLRSRFAP